MGTVPISTPRVTAAPRELRLLRAVVPEDQESNSLFDPLTQLPNQALFRDRLGQAMAQAARYHRKVALLLLNIDGFRSVNDAFGRDAGDLLLQAVASRLCHRTRDSDTVSRPESDTFAVVLPDVGRGENAGIVARKLLAGLADEISLAGRRVAVSAGIGISLFPGDSLDVDGMIEGARAALSHAKGSGRNSFQFFKHLQVL